MCDKNDTRKSTFGQVLARLQKSYEARILVDGGLVRFGAPPAALVSRVAMVHQALAFSEDFTVGVSLDLSQFPGPLGFVWYYVVYRHVRNLLSTIEFDSRVCVVQARAVLSGENQQKPAMATRSIVVRNGRLVSEVSLRRDGKGSCGS